VAAAAEDAAAFAFGGAAPDAVVDVILHRVLKAGTLHRAIRTNAARVIHAHSVAREEGLWRQNTASASGHPLGFHHATNLPTALRV